jgi:hypothetical protein
VWGESLRAPFPEGVSRCSANDRIEGSTLSGGKPDSRPGHGGRPTLSTFYMHVM